MVRARVIRIARRVGIGVGVSLTVVVFAVLLLVSSHGGARAALSFVLSRSPVPVSVLSIEGVLRGPLVLRGVDVEHIGARIHIDQVVLDWRPLSLLRRRVAVDSLQVTGVTGFVPADYPPASDEPAPPPREGPPAMPDLPVDLVLEGVSVEVDRIEMEGRGEVRAVELRLAGSLDDFQMSFALDAAGEPIQELHASGRLSGAADDYRLALDADFVSAGLPSVGLAVGAAGSLTGASIDSARIETESGFATLAADLSWYPRVTWSVASVAELLDVAALTPDPESWPGRLSFEARSEGYLDDTTVVASADVEGLSGTLRGEPIRGELHAEIRSPEVSVDLLELYWGRIEAHASGFVLDTADLEFSVDIPDLGQLLPGARGRVAMEGDLTGTRDRPRVVSSFDIADVLVDSVGVRTASGRIDIDLYQDAVSQIDVRVAGISAGENAVDSVTVVVRGTQGEHDVGVGAWLPGVGLRLAGAGALRLPSGADPGADSVPAWSGRVDSLSLDARGAGPWRLSAPFELFASADSASLSTACLAQNPSEVCVRGGRDLSGKVTGDVRIEAFPLSALPAPLPEEMSIAGRLDGSTTLTLEADGTLLADGTVTTEGVVAALAGADSARFTFGGEGLRFVVDGIGARGDGALTLRSDPEGGVFDVALEADLPGFTSIRSPLDEQELTGRVRIESSDVAFLTAFVPRVDSVGGRFALDASGSGTIAAPVLNGSVRLVEGLVHVDSAGLFMDDIAVTVEADGVSGVTVEGSARSGEGSVRLEGRVTGTRERPAVVGTFDVTDIVVGAIGVQRGFARIDVDADDAVVSQIDVRAAGISSGATTVDSARVIVSGTRSEHDVEIGAWFPGNELHLGASGQLSLRSPADPSEDGTAHPSADSTAHALPAWAGHIDSISLDMDATGAWRLDAPVELFVSADSASLSTACLAQTSAELCVQGARDLSGTLTGDARMERFPLAALSATLPEGMSLAGRLDGLAIFTLDADGTLLADGEITTEGMVSATAGADNARFNFGGDGLRFAVDSVGARGEGALTLRSDPEGGIFDLDVEAELPGFTSIRSPLAEQEVAGRLRIESSELAFLAAFVPTVDSLGGRFALDVAGSGTVGTPALRGSMRLDEGLVHVATAGLFVREITLVAQADEAVGIALEGRARSGQGTVQIEGRTRLEPSTTTPSVLTLRGDRFRAVGTPEIQVEVSPDLEVRYDGATIIVEGQVAVPWARVELLEVPPSAVAPSSDVVIVDEEPIHAPDVDATIRVVVGNDVRFSGLGFTSFIEGDLRVREVPGSTPTVLGELRFVDGRYRAYGQDLTIDRGRVSFAGSAEDAALDVLAVRRAGDGTVAGLEIAGGVAQPEVSLTSDPAMTDADVLSYILYGRPLSDGSASEQTQVAGAAATLGANVITTRLASQVGLDDARIEGATRDQAELVAGKYLTPSVYVSYGVGLFKPSNTFRIKYLLNSKWALRAESGDANGGDIIYQIERGR
jgi:autotransporter translocation and assembly factor TamB